jgi:L-rhamnose-H+ transport protein
MMNDWLLGFAVAVIGGVIGSATLMPMKFVRKWPWEASWLTYSTCAYFIAPWVFAIATVPALPDVYRMAGMSSVFWAIAFGVMWGAGVILYGLAVERVGLSLAMAIILGLSIAVGSLVPILFREPMKFSTTAGFWILAANAVILAGLILCAWAGHLRQSTRRDEQKPADRTAFLAGLTMCVLSGLSAPLLSVALSMGALITESAKSRGAAPLWAGNSVFGLTVSAGALPNILYCGWLLSRNKTATVFQLPESRRNFALCVAMGVCFMSSTVLYGAATAMLGPKLGDVVGWPVYMSSIILGGSFWGWLTGEWKSATRNAAVAMISGVLLLVLGISLLSLSK